ncbi:MAG TPA: YeeE/YedE thiosulfate transporter family protein [Anseongella sp.]|nr:YeeE/YedE thiosulfate transporter family protein [Anseongella sp.]
MEPLSPPSWPWYIAGPLIGLTVPALLLLGNKLFGISSSLKHICAACFPAGIPFFKYDWKKEAWNLFFVAGIVAGAYLATMPEGGNFLPPEISWQNMAHLQGWIFTLGGGFMVGFGTRYAGGCTSGHSITGLSSLQWPSLVATLCFMAGGFAMTHLILPYLLRL